MTLKKIDTKIATFTTNKAKLQQLGHEIAMMIFRHAAPKALPDCAGSGDCSRILKLANAMPKSWMAQLHAWTGEFSPIRFNTTQNTFGYAAKYKAEETPEAKLEWWNIEGANDTPFYEMLEPEPELVLLDATKLAGFVAALAKRIEKKVEDGAVAPTAVAMAQNMVATLSALDFKKVVANSDDEPEVELPVEQEKAAA